MSGFYMHRSREVNICYLTGGVAPWNQHSSLCVPCREEQVKEEVGNCLQMLDQVYRVFGLKYTAELSTRPESRMGEEHQWDVAETALREALESQEAKTGHAWAVRPHPRK